MKKKYLLLISLLLLIGLILSASFARAQWQMIDTIDNGNFVNIHFFDANNGIVSGEMDGRFLLTKNGGLSWDTVQVPFLGMFTDHLTDMQFVTNDIGFVCGGSGFSSIPNILMRTKDGGKTWDSIVVTIHAVYEFTGVDFKQTASDIEGIAFSYGNIYRVTDTGRTFSNIVKPTFNFSILDAVYAGNDKLLLLGHDFTSQSYRMYSSDDWGGSFDLRYKDSLAINSIALSGAFGLAACAKGTILKSPDGGKTWIKQKLAPDSIAFNKVKFGSNGFVYLLGYKTSGNGGGYVYGSDNFGQSWHSVQVDTQMWLSDISMPTIATGYIVSNRKLYKTKNGGGMGLSVEDLGERNDGISVYPNPTSAIVYIEMPEQIKLETLSVYDAAGRMVRHATGVRQLDLSNMASGIYVLEIGTNQGLYKRKLLLQ